MPGKREFRISGGLDTGGKYPLNIIYFHNIGVGQFPINF